MSNFVNISISEVYGVGIGCNLSDRPGTGDDAAFAARMRSQFEELLAQWMERRKYLRENFLSENDILTATPAEDPFFAQMTPRARKCLLSAGLDTEAKVRYAFGEYGNSLLDIPNLGGHTLESIASALGLLTRRGRASQRRRMRRESQAKWMEPAPKMQP